MPGSQHGISFCSIFRLKTKLVCRKYYQICNKIQKKHAAIPRSTAYIIQEAITWSMQLPCILGLCHAFLRTGLFLDTFLISTTSMNERIWSIRGCPYLVLGTSACVPAQNGPVFALSDTILKHALSSKNKAVDCLELTKIVYTLGPGALFCSHAPCTKCERCMTT